MLESVGLSVHSETVYWAMLENPGWGVADLAMNLGLPESDVRDALDRLAENALLQPSAAHPGAMYAVSPGAGLAALLSRTAADLSAQLRQIEHARAAVAIRAAGYETTKQRDEVIRHEGLDAVRDRLTELAHDATSDCLTLTAGPPMPAEAIVAGQQLNRPVLERGVQIRNIYQDSVRNDPATLAYATWMASIGGHSRTLPSVPMRMTIVDREVALIPIDPENGSLGALEIRSDGVVTALCVLFDHLWATATPFGEAASVDHNGLTPQELEVLKLLNSGHTDDATARRLGLSQRTIRRIVADLTERLSVESRFQAGAEAARRGWI